MLLETVAIQDTQHRVFLFIQYLFLDETGPETRKRQKKWADIREAKVRELACVAGGIGSAREIKFWRRSREK